MKQRYRSPARLSCLLMAVLMAATAQMVCAQDFGARLGVRRGGEVSYEPTGPGVIFDALDPAVKKWYVPQELFNEYQWRQWEYSNYARSQYQRYVNIALEGDYFYDLYGNYVTRGVLVYDWRIASPQVAGSNLFKGSRYDSWFNRLVVASDSRGQYYYAMTVGDAIRTTLTPMTFSKPAFTGIQFDVATDKYEATLIASRPSAPGAVGDVVTGSARSRSNDTNLLGGRGTVQIGDFVKVGGTYVNAFNAQTKNQAFQGNPFKGTLTEGQNGDITRLEIRLSDDSPEDGQAGTAYFQEEIIVTTRDGQQRSNRKNMGDNSILTFYPTVQGGFRQEGYLSADGSEVITLIYDLTGPEYRAALGPQPEEIERIEFVLLVANDYRIDVTSNQQTNSNDQPVPLADGIPERTVRAPGNVRDGSNQRFVQITYGLPVANEIFGLTLDITDLNGFYLSGEFDRNRQHKRYPRRATSDPTQHTSSIETADAWFLNLYKRAYPNFLYGEAYSMDPNYSTSSYIAGTQNDLGEFNYDDEQGYVYEFVDDNDDQDRNADWLRRNFSIDTRVFPGWDENNDFIVDFNQNDNDRRTNTTPDYEEPFLRYASDRPEFLFGTDMNNNGIVDRFENDALPDYPYQRDRRGYNLYAGTNLAPEARLTVGRLDERQLADNRSNTSNYLLFTYDRDFPRLGRVRVYDNLRMVKDDIRDDVIEWVLREGSRGDFVPYADPLPMRDAWANAVYLGYQMTAERLRFLNRVKHDWIRQNNFGDRPANEKDIRETATFLGVINKVDYTVQLGAIALQPRWKSEFQLSRPSRKEDQIRVSTTELAEAWSIILRIPILTRTQLQTGFEYLYMNQFRSALENDPLRSDRNELVYALQLSNNVAYLGYDLWTQTGFRIARIDRASAEKARTETRMFITMYAGFGD
ncbi:MAG: hypothetical protein ABIL09_01585 [Gemmatimonadota bacterium]